MTPMEHHNYQDPAKQYEHARGEGSAMEKINELKRVAAESAKSAQLSAALHGEGDFLSRVVELDDPEKQIKQADQVLIHASFLKKLIPNHVPEENQSAFIVAFAQELAEQKNQMQ